LSSGIWVASAGAAVQAQNLDVVANNLANSDTPAFKKDVTTFQEYLTRLEREPTPQDIPRGAIKDKDFYPIDGRDQSFVVMDGTHPSLRQGHLRVTQNELDVALDGPGFLEVNTPHGIRLTRYGALKVLPDGRLATSEGYPILAAQSAGLAKGGDVAARYIHLRDQGPRFQLNSQGDLYAGDTLVARLSIVELKDLKKLKKEGGQLFENLDQTNEIPANRTQLRQGMLETSNVNPIEEMTNMIKANRNFEQDLKMIKTYGELLGREANDIGKL
jgi:flagellar basal-body rod protein FlgG